MDTQLGGTESAPQRQANIRTLDDLYAELSKKVDINKGSDKTMTEQLKVCQIQQKLHEEETIQNQILIQQCLQLRAHISKGAYRDLMYIFGKSYNINNSDLKDQEEDPKQDEEFERAKVTFKDEILPKLMENIRSISLNLRRCLLIAEGQTTHEIMELEEKITKGDGIDFSKIPPISEQLRKMESQIQSVKELLQKTKEIKQELKVEIMTVDEGIDDYVQKISTLVDKAGDNYEAKMKLLTAQTENLSISKMNQMQEFEKQTFDGVKANEIYKQVQDLLDEKISQQQTQKQSLEKQLNQYDSMDPSERLELARMAKDYEALMLQRIKLEKELNQNN